MSQWDTLCWVSALPASASLLSSLGSSPWPWLLLMRACLNAVEPSLLSCHKNPPNSKMQVFAALQKGVGREGEHGLHAPSVFQQGLYFLRNPQYFHVMCVLLNRLLSFPLKLNRLLVFLPQPN